MSENSSNNSDQASRRVLVIDTSYALSVGVAGSEPLYNADSRSHVEKLIPFIHAVLSREHLQTSDLTDVVVATGPGPFTGLRAGIVAARGICFATGARLIGQEVLSPQAWWEMEQIRARHCEHFPQYVAALNDARRKQLYWQLFQISEDGNTLLPVPRPLTHMDIAYPQTIARTIVASLSNPKAGLVIIGHGAAKYHDAWDWLKQSGISVSGVEDISATQGGGTAGCEVFARVALRAADRGEDISSEPLYLRRPDAQLPPPLKPVLENQTREQSVSEREKNLDPSLRAEAPQNRREAQAEASDLAWSSWSDEDLRRLATKTAPGTDDPDDPDELETFGSSHRSGNSSEKKSDQ
jgi:tRNA threonylcarbamoyladenosine biosynthesis protein TsaB